LWAREAADNLNMADEEHRGRIVRLEVNSFKSYRGRNTIGPFRCGRHRRLNLVAAACNQPPGFILRWRSPSRRPFTTIIGPNGSGKSNVMDAVSFVLGVRTAQLRGSLKELLYHNTAGQSAEDRCLRNCMQQQLASLHQALCCVCLHRARGMRAGMTGVNQL
jgi:hypothetical protein